MTSSDRRRLAAVLVAVLLALPLAASAQYTGSGPGAGPGGGQGAGPGPRGPMTPAQVERMEKRMRLARTIGLAEALDLDEASTARLNAVMAPFDARRKAILEGVQGDVRTLRQAARRGDAKALAAVDGAVQRVFDARASTVALDREMFAAVTKGMTPEQVARTALFFAQFRQRFGMEMQDSGSGPGR